MRRKDRERDYNFALDVIDNAPYAVASFVDENNMPYAIPLTITRIGENLYFHSAMEGRKCDILKRSGDVCVSFVYDVEPALDKFTTYYKSAIVKGKAVEITDINEKIEALRALCERFCPSNMPDFDNAIARSISRTAIYKISMDEVTAKGKIHE